MVPELPRMAHRPFPSRCLSKLLPRQVFLSTQECLIYMPADLCPYGNTAHCSLHCYLIAHMACTCELQKDNEYLIRHSTLEQEPGAPTFDSHAASVI